MYLRVFILVAVAAQLFVKAERKNGLHNFVNLGQVDGKSYFYENTYPFFRNWTESGNYCKETGMELATIETVAEAEFLKSKYDPYGFNGWYWTGGRDAQLPRQFTWNSTGTVPTDSIGLDWEIYGETMEYQTCVLYRATTNSSALVLYPCSSDTGYVLCQTQT